MHVARFELLCRHTNSFTHMVCVQVGEDKGIWKRRRQRVHEAEPCKAGCSWSVSTEAGMLGSVQN